MRRSWGGGEDRGPEHRAIPKLIGMLMNNKLVSLARGVSMALGTVCNCGRDSAAGTLSLILLFTMPLISVIFATAQPHFYRTVTRQSSLIWAAARLFVIFLPGRFLVVVALVWLTAKKKFPYLSHPIGETYVSEQPQLQRRKLETRRSPSGRLILWVTDNDKATGRARQTLDT